MPRKSISTLRAWDHIIPLRAITGRIERAESTRRNIESAFRHLMRSGVENFGQFSQVEKSMEGMPSWQRHHARTGLIALYGMFGMTETDPALHFLKRLPMGGARRTADHIIEGKEQEEYIAWLNAKMKRGSALVTFSVTETWLRSLRDNRPIVNVSPGYVSSLHAAANNYLLWSRLTAQRTGQPVEHPEGTLPPTEPIPSCTMRLLKHMRRRLTPTKLSDLTWDRVEITRTASRITQVAFKRKRKYTFTDRATLSAFEEHLEWACPYDGSAAVFPVGRRADAALSSREIDALIELDKAGEAAHVEAARDARREALAAQGTDLGGDALEATIGLGPNAAREEIDWVARMMEEALAAKS